MLCAASWPGDELLKSRIRAFPLASVNELIPIKDRFLFNPEAIEQPLLYWEDGQPDSDTSTFLTKRFCLWFHLQTTTNFNVFVNRLIFETEGPLPTSDTMPEGVFDKLLLRQLFKRVAGIRSFLRHRLIDHILDHTLAKVNSKYRTHPCRSEEHTRRSTLYQMAKMELETRLRTSPEEALSTLVAAVQERSPFGIVLTRSPGFEGLCLDCARRSFLVGDSKNHECWKTWVEADGWDQGCNISHGVCVFMDSFLGELSVLKWLVEAKWSWHGILRYTLGMADLSEYRMMFELRYGESTEAGHG